MNRQNKHILIIWLIVSVSFFSCAHLKEAHRSFDENDYGRTILLCKKAILSDSTDIEAYMLLSKSYRASDSLRLALATLEQAHPLQPDSPQIIEALTEMNIQLGDREVSSEKYRQALSYYERAESLSPTHRDAMTKIAEIHVTNGQLDRAKSKYENLLSVVQDSMASVRLAEIQKKIDYAASLYEKGLQALTSYKYKTAKSFFQKAIHEKSDFTDARYQLLMVEGHILLNRATKKDYWDAISAYGKAATLQSERAAPHYYMAIVYEKKDPDEFVNAIEAYEKALHLEPQGPFADVCKKKIRALKTRKEKLDKFWGRKK